MYAAANQGDPKAWLQAKLEEYRALRGEITESIRAQHQVLVYAFSLMGLLTAASGQVWDKSPFVATFIFWIAIPALSYTFLFVWFGEVEGLVRIGRYLAKIEEEVNARVPGEAMGWERYLRGRRKGVTPPEFRSNYKAVCFVMLAIGFVAPLIGDAASVQLFNEILPQSWYSQFGSYVAAKQVIVGVALWNLVTTGIFLFLARYIYKRGRNLQVINNTLPF
jgi:hypothetical protein